MKSYVTLAQHKCIVCCKDHDTGDLLLDRRLRNTFEHKTLTGWGLCPECKAQQDAGFIALVECDEAKSVVNGGIIKPEDAWRTGNIAWLRASAFPMVFNVPVPDKGLCFVQPGVIEMLQKKTEGEKQ